MDLLANRYQIVRSIGQGGMGVVYEGVDRQTGRPVAIKRLHAHDVSDPTAVERFRREAYATAQLHHPHIIEFLDFVPGPEPAIVLELLQGETLRMALGRQPMLPVDLTVRVAGHVLGALEAAHRAGIVHRDLKPANVFLTSAGQTKLLDFGVAKLLEVQGPPLTRASHVVGSATYMAPEQIRGVAVDGRTDLFAFGLCLYEMLTGQKPYEGGSMHQAMLRIMQGEPVPAHPSLSPPLLQFLRTATHPDPAQRFATALQMNDALSGALYATGTAQQRFDPGPASFAQPRFDPGPASLAQPLLPMQSAPKKSRAGLVALLAILALGALASAGAAVFWLRAPEPAAPVAVASAVPSGVIATAPTATTATTATSNAVPTAGGRKASVQPADAGANRSVTPADGGGSAPVTPKAPSGKACNEMKDCPDSQLCWVATNHPHECQTCEATKRETYCPGTPHVCTNLRTDRSNCGACGNQCVDNKLCGGGKCLSRVSPDGPCENLVQCPGGQACIASTCQCPGTWKFCAKRGVCAPTCE